MKGRSSRVLASAGLAGVFGSIALAGGTDVIRTCAAGGTCGASGGTADCTRDVAWCCCNTVVNGPRTCVCSTGAVCDDAHAPPGYKSCFDP